MPAVGLGRLAHLPAFHPPGTGAYRQRPGDLPFGEQLIRIGGEPAFVARLESVGSFAPRTQLVEKLPNDVAVELQAGGS